MKKTILILSVLISLCFSTSMNSMLKDGRDAIKIRIGGSQWVGDYDKFQLGYALAGIKSPFTIYIYNWDVYKAGIGISYSYFINNNIYSKIGFQSDISSHNNNLRYNNISECCVIGIPDKYFGEAVFLVCVTKKKDKEIENKFRNFLRTRLANFQQPLGYDFVPELPKNRMVKIFKREVKKIYLKKKLDLSKQLRKILN